MDPAVCVQGLTTTRAALVGPFQGPTLPVALPTPLDKPQRLAQWAPAPRMTVCELELLMGLHFDVDQSNRSMTLGFVDLGQKPFKGVDLVKLMRPTEKIFRQQLDYVAQYAELREDRGAEVLSQISGCANYWADVIGLTAHRHKYTAELLDLALSLATSVEMRFKHGFACTRPVDMSPQIQPMIPTPGHASWPSGHATESYLMNGVLRALLPHGAKYHEQFERLAARMAVNRTVAGLHFPVDSAAGRLLGTALADFMVARCKGAKIHERAFDGRKFHDAQGHAIDFDPRVSMSDNKSGYYELSGRASPIAASGLLRFMWTKAAAEWEPLE